MFSSANVNVVLLVTFTALLDSYCIRVVKSQDQHYWGISCYKISETKFTWSDARDECKNLGCVLAVPSSDQENEFAAQLSDGVVWIDCNDQEVGGGVDGSAERVAWRLLT